MADAGIGEAAAAEGAKGAGEAAAAGAADAGIGAAAAGFGSAADAAILGDAAIGSSIAADTAAIGAGTLGADIAGGSALAADAGAAAAGGSALGSALPEVTVTGTAGGGSSALGAGLGAAGLGAAAGAAGGAGGAGSVSPSVKAQDVPQSATSDVPDTSGFLPATSDTSVTPLSDTFAQSLGITPGADFSVPGAGIGTGEPLTAEPVLSDASGLEPGLVTNPNLGGGGIMDFLSSPKNDFALARLGISGLTALRQPKLPGAAQTALGAAGTGVQQAQQVISSGGTASPLWNQQKASIDATIDQQIQQQSAAIQQAAANSGMGGANSGVVQQQIASMTQNLNLQRQQLYMQAQQQNVSNAVSELTGSNSVLSSIAQMQFAQQKEALAAAAQTAELAGQLEGLLSG